MEGQLGTVDRPRSDRRAGAARRSRRARPRVEVGRGFVHGLRRRAVHRPRRGRLRRGVRPAPRRAGSRVLTSRPTHGKSP
jgi:hypothetical protein